MKCDTTSLDKDFKSTGQSAVYKEDLVYKLLEKEVKRGAHSDYFHVKTHNHPNPSEQPNV